MITSAGGCCDCGDPEAWSEGVYCSLHQPEGNETEEEEVGGAPSGGAVVFGGLCWTSAFAHDLYVGHIFLVKVFSLFLAGTEEPFTVHIHISI